MNNFLAETAANANAFTLNWQQAIQETMGALAASKPTYVSSYRRLVSIQAWRVDVLENRISSDSLEFFLEAQNDGLTSHMLASVGAWRSSLQSLRSCIENVCYCLFYKDHPVEFRQWQRGQHRLAFSEMHKYLLRHPDLDGIPPEISGLTTLDAEYSTLSRAVHGSGKTFRMTEDVTSVQLFTDDRKRLGMWNTRAKSSINAINRILLSIYRTELTGARLPNVRKAISLAIPSSHHAEIYSRLGVTLFS